MSEMRDVTQEDHWKTTTPGLRFTAFGSSRLEVKCVERGKEARMSVGLREGMDGGIFF